MNSRSFYLRLPSGNSLDYFPDNTLTQYRVKLPRELTFSGKWEVGLTEIQYPRTWYNLSDDEGWMHMRPKPDDKMMILKLKGGYYPNSKFLLNAMKGVKSMSKSHGKIGFEYDEITQKVTITVQKGAEIILSPRLGVLLGFADTEGVHMKFTEGVHTGQWVCDVNQGFTSLYVYTDIIEPTMVGNTYAPLLRIVPVSGKHGNTVTKDLGRNIQYYPLQQKAFDTIEIDIRKNTGEKVKFERGRVVVTLNFRQSLPL